MKDQRDDIEKGVEARLEEFEKLFQLLEKRFDDIKWYIGGVGTLFAVVFSVLTLVSSWNYNTEKNGLEQFKTELRADLGKAEVPPELEILGTDGAVLADQEVPAKVVTDKDGNKNMELRNFVRNNGGSPSGNLYIKFYANDPIHLLSQSTDEKKFKYETYIRPENIEPRELPAHFSTEHVHTLNLEKEPPAGKYLMLMKIYYGKAKVVQTQFKIVVKAN